MAEKGIALKQAIPLPPGNFLLHRFREHFPGQLTQLVFLNLSAGSERKFLNYGHKTRNFIPGDLTAAKILHLPEQSRTLSWE